MEIPQTPTPEVSLEQKEKEQLPILFIYRDNDLFEDHMPEIINNLQAWGRKVETQIFQQGTDTEEIEEWINSNQDSLVGKEIVSDGTVSMQISNDLKGDLKKKGAMFGEKLDSIFYSAAWRVISGNLREEVRNLDVDGLSEREQDQKRDSYRTEKGIERIFQNYFKRGGEIPKRFYILKKLLYDHEPFPFQEAYLEIQKAKKNYPEQADKIREKYQQDAAETVKKWLLNAGIPENIIHIVGNISKENENDLVQTETWFIRDRHNDDSDYDYKYKRVTLDGGSVPYNNEFCLSHNVKTFSLPFGNFEQTAGEQGLIDADPRELRQTLNDAFKKLFVEQAEEK